METLKAGDRVYAIGSNTNEIKRVITIERITKTQAIGGGYKFKLEYYDKHIRLVGDGAYSMLVYRLETPELIETLKIQRILRSIKTFDFASLPIDKLDKVAEIINS